jgi:hypothetical protein
MIEIRNEDNFATWRAHCGCGWSSHLLFGREARDLAASRHLQAAHPDEEFNISKGSAGLNAHDNSADRHKVTGPEDERKMSHIRIVRPTTRELYDQLWSYVTDPNSTVDRDKATFILMALEGILFPEASLASDPQHETKPTAKSETKLQCLLKANKVGGD